MWSRLGASVSCSDGPFFLLCCVCMWTRLCVSASCSGGPFFLLCYVSVCGPVYALVYLVVAVRSSRCVVCLYVDPSMR
jgi:hypothetical protein